VADYQLRGIDGPMVEKIKLIARERNWSINDVMLHLLRQALGLIEPEEQPKGQHDIAQMTGTFAQDEAAAFRAAIEAFERLPEDNSEFRKAGQGR
jgi:hypothetical protein